MEMTRKSRSLNKAGALMSRNESIAYGVRPVETLVESGLPIKKIYFEQGKADTKFQTLRDTCQAKNIPYDEKSLRFIEKLCGSPHHQGVMALYTPVERRLCFENPDYIPKTGWFLCLYLDGIQDPQNLGAIVRSAEFFGVDQIFYPEHHSASFNQVALKTSAGGGIYNPPYKVSSVSSLFGKFQERNFQIIGTDPDKGENLAQADFRTHAVVVIGSEGEGMSDRIRHYCTRYVNIERLGKVTSLNASVSAGVILYQIRTHRNFPGN